MDKEDIMRKVNMTKQQTVRPQEKWFGFSLKQIIVMAIGGIIVATTFVLLLFVIKLPTELVMTLTFIEIIATVFLGVVRVNGMSIIKWFVICMKGPIVRPYQSKGAKFYEEENYK